MRKAVLGSVLLAMSIACTGCSSGGDGGAGGSGGPNEAASFDADTALPASSASAIAMALGAQLGLAVSSVIDAIGEAPAAAELGLTPKGGPPMTITIPGLCPGSGMGTAILSFDGPPINVGEQVTLTFTDCVGSVFSGRAINGTLVLAIEAVSGGFPSKGTATVNLTVGTDTTITGSFKAIATLIGTLVDLCLGDQRGTDILTITRGTETIEFACFKIRQEISLVTGAADGAFEPVGVVRRNRTQVFTLNSYTQPPPPLDLVGGVPISGSINMSSGDGTSSGSRPSAGPFCAPFGNTPLGNNSFIANAFAGEACVMVNGEDANGAPFSFETSQSKLLNADFTQGGSCGAFTCDVPAGAAIRTITDSDFQDSNWKVEIVATDGAIVDEAHNPISERATEGGVRKSPFRRMTHFIEDATKCDGNGCTVGVVHKLAATCSVERCTTYNPSMDGAIDFINYTESQRFISTNFASGAVGWAFAVVQDGRRYNGPATTAFDATDWTINGLCGLTEDDFGPPDGPHPNFTDGKELTFVYIRSNSNTSMGGQWMTEHGIDDFKVVIVKEAALP